MPRTIRRQLICPACAVVIADATYTRWPGNLELAAPDGTSLMPDSVGVLLRRAEVEFRDASSAAAEQEAQARVEFLRRNVGELVYDLRCRNGHRVLRTMPQLVRTVRDAGGMWADPG